MKNNTVVRLLALVLALLMAVPATAMAEEEIVFAEMVEEAVSAEGEYSLEMGGAIEAPDVDEPAVEEPDVEEPAAEEPVVEEASAGEAAAGEAPAEEPAVEEAAGEPVEIEAPVPGEDAVEDAGTSSEEAVELVEEDAVEAVDLMAGETTPTETTTQTETDTAEAVPSPQNYTSETLTKNTKRTLNIGDTLQLVTAATPLSYKSSKKKVASVSATGLVTAKAAGKTRITIKLTKKKKIAVTVTVKDPYAPDKVSISADSSVLYIGMGTAQLTASLTPAYAKTSLKWKSSNKKVLKVSADGVLTPVKAGTARITVTTANKKKASVKITVKKNISAVINAKPSKALIKSLGANWTIGPKTVERDAAGNYICNFWIINNLGKSKSKQISNLGLDL